MPTARRCRFKTRRLRSSLEDRPMPHKPGVMGARGPEESPGLSKQGRRGPLAVMGTVVPAEVMADAMEATPEAVMTTKGATGPAVVNLGTTGVTESRDPSPHPAPHSPLPDGWETVGQTRQSVSSPSYQSILVRNTTTGELMEQVVGPDIPADYPLLPPDFDPQDPALPPPLGQGEAPKEATAAEAPAEEPAAA